MKFQSHKMRTLVLFVQLILAVPYPKLKSVRQSIRENRRHYVANAKMFDRINKRLEVYENRTQALEEELSQVKHKLEVVEAKNLMLKADINKLNTTEDYDYESAYSR